MTATMDAYGVLTIAAETPLEEYALHTWEQGGERSNRFAPTKQKQPLTRKCKWLLFYADYGFDYAFSISEFRYRGLQDLSSYLSQF